MPRKPTRPTSRRAAAPAKPQPLTLDLATVENLTRLLEQSQLTELELVVGDARLFISRNSQQPQQSGVPMYMTPFPVAPPVPTSPPVALDTAVSPALESAITRKLVEVTSPMVGTFYSAPSPDTAPYLRLGDIVQEGQTLCIIEAMKLMNEIEAETAGRIMEICVRNAQPVEFGTVLFRIEPLG